MKDAKKNGTLVEPTRGEPSFGFFDRFEDNLSRYAAPSSS
jgi:hypothetical protein